jgi:hypothetical protein
VGVGRWRMVVCSCCGGGYLVGMIEEKKRSCHGGIEINMEKEMIKKLVKSNLIKYL